MASNRQRSSDTAEAREKIPRPAEAPVSDDSDSDAGNEKGLSMTATPKVSCFKQRSLGFWTCQICVVYLIWMFLSPFIYYFIFERASSMTRKSASTLTDAGFPLPDPSQNPDDLSNIFWFSHTTDLHISDDLLPEVQAKTHYHKVFRSQQRVFHPAFFLVTGDLTNGLDESGYGGGYQKPAEWAKYRNILEPLGLFDPRYYIDIPGNHDNYVVPHFTHKGNLYATHSVTGPLLVEGTPRDVTHGQLRYQRYETEDEFPVFGVSFQPAGQGAGVAPPLYLLFMDTNAKPGYQYRLNMFGAIRGTQVDTMRSVLKGTTTVGSSIFGVSHAPFAMSRDSFHYLDPLYDEVSRNSKKGDGGKKSSLTGISGHICGHTHVLGQVHRVGRGSTISYTGGSLYSHSQFRTMFVDHGLVSILDGSYEELIKESNAMGLVTFPKPAGLLSEAEPWENMATDLLRAIVFGWGPEGQFDEMTFSFVLDEKERISLANGTDCMKVDVADLKFDTVPDPAKATGDQENPWMAVCRATYDHKKYASGIHQVRIEGVHNTTKQKLVRAIQTFSLDGTTEGNWFGVNPDRPWTVSSMGAFMSFFLGQAPEHNWSYYAIVVAFAILFVYALNGFMISRWGRAWGSRSGSRRTSLLSNGNKGKSASKKGSEAEMTVHVDQQSPVDERDSMMYQESSTPRLRDEEEGKLVDPKAKFGGSRQLIHSRQKTPNHDLADTYRVSLLSLRYSYILVLLCFVIPYGFGPIIGKYSWGTYMWWGTVSKDYGPDGGLQLGYDGYQGGSLILVTGFLLVPYILIMRGLEREGRPRGFLHNLKPFRGFIVPPGVWIALIFPVIVSLIFGKIFFVSNVFSVVWGPAGYLLSPGFFAIPWANFVIGLLEVLRYRKEALLREPRKKGTKGEKSGRAAQ